MKFIPIVLTASFVLSGLCLATGTNAVGQVGTSVTREDYLVVTQNACRVFSTAQNRKVDRMRLCKAVQKSLAVDLSTVSVVKVGMIGGLRVESVNYIESNKVEAVFSVCH